MNKKFIWLFILLFAFCHPSYGQTPEAGAAPIDQAQPVETPKPSDTAEPQSPSVSLPGETGGASSYMYDLRDLINKSKRNIKQVNEKIKEQAVIKRNQKREEKAREYYEQALKLFEQGKFNEARALWEKAVKITEHPEMKGYIRESERRFKAQANALRKEEQEYTRKMEEDERAKGVAVEGAYNAGVMFYKQKNYKQAKEEFIAVEEMMPDYKATRSYLKIIDQDLIQAETEMAKEQRAEMERQQKEAEESRLREKEEWRKEIERKERERLEQLESQASEVYKLAVSLYKEKKYKEAKARFQEVEWVVPDYKRTRRYLNRIDRDIEAQERRIAEEENKRLEEQRWQEELAKKKLEQERLRQEAKSEEDKIKQAREEAAFVYKAAVALLKKKQFPEALEKFKQVEEISPNYRDTRKRIGRITERLDKEKAQAEAKAKAQAEVPTEVAKPAPAEAVKAEPQESAPSKGEEQKEEVDQKQKSLQTQDKAVLAQTVQPVYEEAIDLYEAKDYASAQSKFLEVERILPDHEATRHYLNRIEFHMFREDYKKKKEEQIRKTQEVTQLAQKANLLYTEIQKIAGSDVASTRKKMAQIDKLFSRLQDQYETLLAQILAQEEEQIKEELLKQAEPVYAMAVQLFKEERYEEAKKKFLEVETIVPNFRSTRTYLARVDRELGEITILAREAEEREALDQLKAERDARALTEEEKLRQAEAEEDAKILALVDQANQINDEILALAKERQFDPIKEKFVELEQILVELKLIKNAIAQREFAAEQERIRRKEDAERKVALAKSERLQARSQKREQMRMDREAALRKKREAKEAEAAAREQAQTIKAEAEAMKAAVEETAQDNPAQDQSLEPVVEAVIETPKAEAPAPQTLAEVPTFDPNQIKALIKEGIGLYKKRDWEGARAAFMEVLELDPGSDRAHAYLEKIDRQLIKAQKAADRKESGRRDAYLKERLKQERAAKQRLEIERKRQRKLTRQLEREARKRDIGRRKRGNYAESLGLRRPRGTASKSVEASPAAVKKERPAPKERLKKEKKPAPEAKIEPQAVVAASAAPASVVPAPVVAAAATSVPAENLTEEQREKQKEISDKRKEVKQKQYDEEQKAKAAAEKAEQEKQRREELAKKKEEARQAKIAAREERARKKQEAKEAKAKKREEAKQARLAAKQEAEAKRKAEAEEKLKKAEEARQAAEAAKAEEEKKRQEELAAKQKIAEEERLLAEERAKLAAEKAKFEEEQRKAKLLEEERAKQQELLAKQQKEEEERLEEAKRLEELRAKQEEEKRKLEELKLARDRELERMRLEEEKKKEEIRLMKEKARIEAEERRKMELAAERERQAEEERRQAELRAEREKQLELQRAVAERQAKLDAEREQLRQELLSGVEEMYREALSLHKAGRFGDAKAKFADIEDIMPDYKKTRAMLKRIDNDILEERRSRPLAIEDVPVSEAPVFKPVKQTARPEPVIETPVESVDLPPERKDAVTDALDLFDSSVTQ